MINRASVKRSAYFDSITLMQLARSLTDLPGVTEAAAIMATEANLQLLEEAGLTPFEGITGTPAASDVLIVVRAGDEASAAAALQAAEEKLSQRGPVSSGEVAGAPVSEAPQPRSLDQAVRLHPQAKLALISVPGSYAAFEAERALRAGLHVFMFSDNVSLEREIALKKLSAQRGLLLMGPDCGTAMLNGVGLGFVNVVPRGPVGIVGASGTGTQQVMSLIAQQGCGVSQVIGCGGRDLSEEVGAVTTLQGLQLLEDDAQTSVIVLISKPPAPAVARRVLDVAVAGSKPLVVIFVGADHAALQSQYGERAVIARDLTEAALKAVELCGGANSAQSLLTAQSNTTESPPALAQKLRLAALFSGGTLCDEALHIWGERLGPVYSNIPLNPAWKLVQGQHVTGHYALDLGADEYTHGRPHPMIDPALRLKRLREEAANPRTSVIMLDMVLGYCSHADPAAIYTPVIQEGLARAAREGRSLRYVLSLCGTEGDPQRLSVQKARFAAAGAEVYVSNAEAARRCVELVAPGQEER